MEKTTKKKADFERDANLPKRKKMKGEAKLSLDDKKMVYSWIQRSTIKPHPEFPEVLYDIDMKILGNFARLFRKKYRIKLVEVQEETGIKHNLISALESGKKRWSMDYLAKYVNAVRGSTFLQYDGQETWYKESK